MRVTLASSLALTWAALASALPSGQAKAPSCRFASQYTQQQVLRDPSKFINDMLYWEGQFHQNNVSYNTANGMSYDGTNIDWVTGERTVKHPFSAASKEVSCRVCNVPWLLKLMSVTVAPSHALYSCDCGLSRGCPFPVP
jgi:hypothetical protein